jgi:hypothetical protein
MADVRECVLPIGQSTGKKEVPGRSKVRLRPHIALLIFVTSSISTLTIAQIRRTATMHAFTLTAVALLSTLAAAQIPGLPSCAAGCVGSSFGSCSSLDVKCICSSTELLSGLSCCVSTACSVEDQESKDLHSRVTCDHY